MRIGKVCLFIICVLLIFWSCNNDDGNNNFTVIELRDRDEVQQEDMDSLNLYLATHYYNSGDFVGNFNPHLGDIVITELAEGETDAPANHTMLNDAVGDPISLVFAETDYQYYLLNLNQGGGTESPNFADNVRLSYEGFLLDGSVFDSAITPVDFDLVSLIPGWRKVIPQFNTSESFMELGDGSVDFVNNGLGIMFLPSGLAYFASAQGIIGVYTPIIFKFELYQAFENDHDNDGIPSYLEDLNGDGEFTLNTDAETLDGDDTDNDGAPNYFDPDDDGDGVLTINEDSNGDGDPTNDIGKNGIPKYLDPEETESNES
ncbi:FKBP-type peptidyl-prolyl cis-trans isomerase [Hyunsoonleella aestuarii]|uniref:Peptidyl-prolyl cis-trans isomerase n=1 Tax=Hyunsoonleella aestuarii TaxID=912802 RepID=A0ABP8EE64_9FLAO|nr:FKBP-type peptidyl-prolyl cis-trans isomerase [Hyunsoonleella aestuarii]